MRTKTLIHGFKNSQKIRVMVDGFGIFMTIGDIPNILATTSHRVAVWDTVVKLARNRRIAMETFGPSGSIPTGIGNRTRVYQSIDDSVDFDVQIDLL